MLDEDSYTSAEANDLVRKRFIKAWESLMNGPKANFTEGNYRSFFGMAIDTLVKPWEKTLGIMKYSEVREHIPQLDFSRRKKQILTLTAGLY